MNDNQAEPAQTGSIGESDEVVDHHIKSHQAICGRWEIKQFRCPCGTSTIFLCVGCGQPMAAGRYGDTWCACIRKMDAAARRHGDTSLRLL